MGDLEGWSWGGVLGRSSCHEEVDGRAKSDSFSRLCSTVIAADHSAGIGDNWDEIVGFAYFVHAILLERLGVSGSWKTTGLIDLAQHRVGGLRDERSCETSEEARAQVDCSLSSVGDR